MRMTVVCRFTRCPYCYQGFCTKETIKIDELGMCSLIWKRGQQRNQIQFYQKYKKNLTIIDYEENEGGNEIKQQETKKNEQGGKTQNDAEESKIQKNDKKCE